MFISKRNYKALVESRDTWKRLAEKGITLSERLLNNNEKAITACKELIEQNKSLNEKLERIYTEENK